MSAQVLDKLLALRPTNAVARLGASSRLPLLNPRDLVRALADAPAALPSIPVYSKAALPGLLRAARTEDAVLGLVCPHPLAERTTAEKFMEALRWASAVASHERPVYLEAGPLRVTREEEAALKDGLFRVVDAGFTLVSLDVTRLTVEDAVATVAAIAAPVVERELSLEVSLPALEGALAHEAARALLEGLTQAGVPVRFVRAAGQGDEPDVDGVRALVDCAQAFGASLSAEEPLANSFRTLPAYVAAGVRKLSAPVPFGRVALNAHPAEERLALAERALGAGVPAHDLLGLLEERLPALDARARERVEALSFGEAVDLFSRVGATRTARRSMAFLAERAGY
ncbi:hypothetical protein FGE12_16590 [Aggregicoccus sp. 17bor-14]|uniref:hypothetical protein n=1 Tax=Myxococcaceae TaxID=31 RepID=UPI00129C75F7|nr:MULTISPECIES: hypothetical protein [Myxococcaceae]MBF5044018.1 hypothetical protein [Simulacricoccus sp. 17bor-14]MRI89769.1 hypothetical protein [Aggregicoccus sp. 17bor-14]